MAIAITLAAWVYTVTGHRICSPEAFISGAHTSEHPQSTVAYTQRM
jgi:hypothetical protein